MADGLEQVQLRTIHDRLIGSGECAQILSKALGITVIKERFNFQVRTFPNWNGADKQAAPGWRESQQTAAAVARVCCDLNQTPSPQRLESCRQGGLIHCEQGCNCRHSGRVRAVQGHH